MDALYTRPFNVREIVGLMGYNSTHIRYMSCDMMDTRSGSSSGNTECTVNVALYTGLQITILFGRTDVRPRQNKVDGHLPVFLG